MVGQVFKKLKEAEGKEEKTNPWLKHKVYESVYQQMLDEEKKQNKSLVSKLSKTLQGGSATQAEAAVKGN